MNSLIAILGLAFLVLLHEAGHFYTARAVGMRPRKFYVGFPPAIAKVQRDGIEYGIGAIPLGGYVKIPGMHRPAPSEVDAHFGRAIQEAPQLIGPAERLKRLLAEGDFDGAAGALKALGAHGGGRRPLAGGARRGWSGASPRSRTSSACDAYWRQRTWKKIAVIGAGPGHQPRLRHRSCSRCCSFWAPAGRRRRSTRWSARSGRAGRRRPRRSACGPATGSSRSTGRPVDASKMFELIVESEGKPVRVTVERGGREVVLGPVAAVRGHRRRLSHRLPARRSRISPSATAIGESFRLTWLITKEIGGTLSRLVRGSGREEISSPIGIVRGSSDALDRGWETYLWVLGLISLSLALLNLLPLLPLDGGHIAFSIIEGVRGRSVGREVYERVSRDRNRASC